MTSTTKTTVSTKHTFLAAWIIASFLSLPPSAEASNVITDCGQNCNLSCSGDPDCRVASGSPKTCILTADITCDSTESTIELGGGTDLDLQGYDIHCSETSPATCDYSAVTMYGGGSIVKSDNSGEPEAVIDGRFTFGIDCDLQNDSRVEGITVFDTVTGINDCAKVQSNVVGGTTQFSGFGTNAGIKSDGVANSDFINDNYVSGRVHAIFHAGAMADVIGNVIHTGANAFAIWLGAGESSISGNTKRNVVFSSGGAAWSQIFEIGAGTDNVSYDGNFCDEDHPGCADCIADGRCDPFTSPFAGN